MPQNWEIPGFLENRGGRLFLQGHDVTQLGRERGTPLYVYSGPRIVETARQIRGAFVKRHDKATICYASKALSSIKVLRWLAQEGISIEVNSAGELFRAKLAGFGADRIIFNGVSKSVEDIKAALSPAIKAINVDSLFELRRIIDVARGLETQARIALRVVPGVDSPTSPGNRTGSEGTKFGILQRELPAALDLIAGAGDAVIVVGLHAHIGSQIVDTQPYLNAVDSLGRIFHDLQGRLKRPFDHLNIGGGFPLPYMRGTNRTPQGDIFAPKIDVEDIAAAVLPPLRKSLGAQVEIIVEPGRRMVGDSAIMLSAIENTKQRSDGTWHYLDAGYNALVESYTYKWYYHSLTAGKLDEELADFRLVGPLCDNGDAFFDVDGEQTLERLVGLDPAFAERRDILESILVRLPRMRRLARSTAPGDIVAFLNTGAYTLDQFTPNNGRTRPEVGIIDLDGSYQVLRRRDSHVDLLFNEVF